MLDLRSLQSKIKDYSYNLDKKNPELNYFMELELKLMSEERSRPVAEQFPLVRADIDKLLTIAKSLTEKTKLLTNAGLNRSNEMECAVNRLFVEN